MCKIACWPRPVWRIAQMYTLTLEPSSFLTRRDAVDAPLPLGTMPRLFERSHRAGRADAPLFTTPNALQTKIEALLPPEARICLAQGLCLAGGFASRAAASLAGLCDEFPPAQQPPPVFATTTFSTATMISGTHEARPDIDFFFTTAEYAPSARSPPIHARTHPT
jgi:hypothetical protein